MTEKARMIMPGKCLLSSAFVVGAVLIGFQVRAECPPADRDAMIATITLERDRVLAFPIGSDRGDEVTHWGAVHACVVDPETNTPVSAMGFELLPYDGKVEGRGPETFDFKRYNPVTGTLTASGRVLEVETTGEGEIVQRNLRRGQYALVPKWATTKLDSVRVYFHSVSTLAVDVPVERMVSTSGGSG